MSPCRQPWRVFCVSVATLTSPCGVESDASAVSSALTLFFEAESELWVAPIALALFFMPETDPGREEVCGGPGARRSQSPNELRVKTVAARSRRRRRLCVCAGTRKCLSRGRSSMWHVRRGRLRARHAKWVHIKEKVRKVPPWQQLLQVEGIDRGALVPPHGTLGMHARSAGRARGGQSSAGNTPGRLYVKRSSIRPVRLQASPSPDRFRYTPE